MLNHEGWFFSRLSSIELDHLLFEVPCPILYIPDNDLMDPAPFERIAPRWFFDHKVDPNTITSSSSCRPQTMRQQRFKTGDINDRTTKPYRRCLPLSWGPTRDLASARIFLFLWQGQDVERFGPPECLLLNLTPETTRQQMTVA